MYLKLALVASLIINLVLSLMFIFKKKEMCVLNQPTPSAHYLESSDDSLPSFESKENCEPQPVVYGGIGWMVKKGEPAVLKVTPKKNQAYAWV